MTFTAESPPARASCSQGSSSNGCCLFKFHHGPTNVRLSFPTPTNDMSEHVESTGVIMYKEM